MTVASCADVGAPLAASYDADVIASALDAIPTGRYDIRTKIALEWLIFRVKDLALEKPDS